MLKNMLLVAVNAKYAHTSLALRSIKTYANLNGLENIDYMEFTINDSYYSILEGILNKNSHYIGLSCYIWNIEIIKELVRDIKKIKPNTKVFLGGPETTYNENIFDEIPNVDFIVRGEGELPITLLLKGIENVKGVCYANEQPTVADSLELDQIPFVYSKEELAKLKNRAIYYETSRGCPFSCSFCLSSFTKGVRTLSMERIFNDINSFIEAGVNKVKLVDRTFNYDKKRAYEIFSYIIDNSINTCFHFEIGADLLDDDIIALLKTAKKNQIQFEAGIQSTNEKVLLAVNRKTNMDKLKNNIKAMSGGNIRLHVDLIAGLPYEDYETFKNSFNETFYMKPHIIQLGFLKLLHGSNLRKNKDSYGFLFRETAPYEILQNKWISFNEIMKLKKTEKAVDIYYNKSEFNNALKYIFEANNIKPYDLFYMLGEILFSVSKPSFKQQFVLIWECYKRKKMKNQEEFLEHLKLDYVKKYKGPLPDIFKNYKTKGFINECLNFLKDEENRKMYFEEYSRLPVKELIKFIDFDIFCLNSEIKTYCFDRNRDLVIDLSNKILYN